MKQITQALTLQNDKAKAMQCFGKMVYTINNDPDPKAQDKITDENNCKNCGDYQYCCKLADTLQ